MLRCLEFSRPASASSQVEAAAWQRSGVMQFLLGGFHTSLLLVGPYHKLSMSPQHHLIDDDVKLRASYSKQKSPRLPFLYHRCSGCSAWGASSSAWLYCRQQGPRRKRLESMGPSNNGKCRERHFFQIMMCTLHTGVDIYAYIYIYIYLYIYIYVDMYIRICIYIYIYVYVYIYVHVHMYTYMRTYLHTYIHT